MSILIFSFTRKGTKLNRSLLEKLAGEDIRAYGYKKFLEEDDILIEIDAELKKLIGESFSNKHSLIFIGAIGIAVRSIAPFIKDKFSDPAVICIDEAGEFVIPILSGHVGGANELAAHIAELLSAKAVISTATDINNKFAVDSFAKKFGYHISDRKLAKEISAAVLEGEEIGFFSDFEEDYELPSYIIRDSPRRLNIYISYRASALPSNAINSGNNVKLETFLRLIPSCLCLGLGCRKDVAEELMQQAFDRYLLKHDIDKRAIKKISSIKLKKDEKAILSLAKRLNVDFVNFSAEELAGLEGNFSESAFVKSITGVGSVCERAAKMVYPHMLRTKEAYAGITFALSSKKVIK